ncbi:MAG: hypothetical protein CMP22_06695 [Rickettsiales bacterium]|nr:hypothetical protein [Rickettsiales bacterium]
MQDFDFYTILSSYADNPLILALLLFLTTFLLEDLATTLGALFAVAGYVSVELALFAVISGIVLGDLGLYALGYSASKNDWLQNKVKGRFIDKTKDVMGRHVVATTLSARFVPGMRLPTYLAIGYFKLSFTAFFYTAMVGVSLWSVLLFSLFFMLGDAARDFISMYQHYALIAAIILGITIPKIGAWLITYIKEKIAPQNNRTSEPNYIGQYDEKKLPNLVSNSKYLSYFEFWPKSIFYFPMKLYSIYLVLKFKGLTLATITNPEFDMGGFVGESKTQILNQVPEELSSYFCPFIHDEIHENEEIEAVITRIESKLIGVNIGYPFVIKPDVGACGAGVRKIDNKLQLNNYLESFPSNVTFLIQQLSTKKYEAGLFYIREPEAKQGYIFSLTLKYFPIVYGDGQLTLKELIKQDKRAGQLYHKYEERHRSRLDEVIPKGELVCLSFAGSHSQGAIFKDGSDFITPAMEEKWDQFCQKIPEFYLGRFDVRFNSIKDLQNCENIDIVEINGSGSEATHIWDAEYSLIKAYKVLAKQYHEIFKIGAMNRERGYKPASALDVIKRIRRNSKLDKQYPYTS